MGYAHPLLAEAQSQLALARLLSPVASLSPAPPPGPLELALDALQTGESAYAAGHPLLADLMVNFGQAVLLSSPGQPHPHCEAAVSHCQMAAAALSDALGERSPSTVRARLVLGQLLALCGQTKQAAEQLRRAHGALVRGAGGGGVGQLQQQQAARSHVLLRFLLEYAKFFR